MSKVCENETVADIVKDMRSRIDAGDGVFYHIEGKRGLQIADRIEAAHRREVAELRKCLKEAYGDKIGTYVMRGNEVAKWHDVLESTKGSEDEGK